MQKNINATLFHLNIDIVLFKSKNYLWFAHFWHSPNTSVICSSQWKPLWWIHWCGERNSWIESHFLHIRKPWSWFESSHWHALHLPSAGIWCTLFSCWRASSTLYTVTGLIFRISASSYGVYACDFCRRKLRTSLLFFVFFIAEL